MRIIPAKEIENTIHDLCIHANTHIPTDVINALTAAKELETGDVARGILEDILENDRLAAAENLPSCQDTGMAVVFVDIGQEVHVDGDLTEAIQAGVRNGYQDGYLRKSIVSDPLDRINTGDNTPAMITLRIVPGDRLKITVAPKGFGCENMSRLAMLKPAEGENAVRSFILDTILSAGPNACPPMVVGVGIGGSFDKVAEAAKRALLRTIGSRHPDPKIAQMEKDLEDAANRSGIGPQGFGGRTTVLAIFIETLPTHIAALPVAVNINCHAARHESRTL